MKNKYGNTPQEAARAEVLDMLEALALTDEDRKHFARMYYKFAHKWKFEVGAILET